MMKKQTKGHHEETNRQTEAEHSVEKLALSLTQKKKRKVRAMLEVATKYKYSPGPNTDLDKTDVKKMFSLNTVRIWYGCYMM